MNVRYYDQRPDCVGGLKYPTILYYTILYRQTK